MSPPSPSQNFFFYQPSMYQSVYILILIVLILPAQYTKLCFANVTYTICHTVHMIKYAGKGWNLNSHVSCVKKNVTYDDNG